MEAASVLWNISRAFLARLLFVVHSVATVWQTCQVTGADWLWGFALLILLVVFEGSHTIIMRAGDERRWFCTSVLLYVLATAPPIWMLERHLCDLRAKSYHNPSAWDEDEVVRVTMVEQVMLVVLILGRWLLPKGEISSEQLSQILLAYLAIASDIVEFFDVFKEPVVYRNRIIQNIVLFAWTLSLFQFPFVITTSRARKMRVAITNNEEFIDRRAVWKITKDVDLWAIVLANVLQDIPFLLVRLYLMLFFRLSNYTMTFFTCKNALIIILQTYRAFVLISSRYMKKDEKGDEKRKPNSRKRRDSRVKEDEELMLEDTRVVRGTIRGKKKERKMKWDDSTTTKIRNETSQQKEVSTSGSTADYNRNARRIREKERRKERERRGRGEGEGDERERRTVRESHSYPRQKNSIGTSESRRIDECTVVYK